MHQASWPGNSTSSLRDQEPPDYASGQPTAAPPPGFDTYEMQGSFVEGVSWQGFLAPSANQLHATASTSGHGDEMEQSGPAEQQHPGGNEAEEQERLSNARMPKKPKPRQPAPDGVLVTDKSCARCRVRKVRCNRVFPRCDHCTARNEDCDLRDWRPRPKVKPTDPARVAQLEERLAELEKQLVQEGSAPQPFPADAFDFPPDITAFQPAQAQKIGPTSLDWRLAEPQMLYSLSRHLREAFTGSCCSLLPTFDFFRARMSDVLSWDEMQLSAAQKVALTTFCAIGARTSPHSAVLGISLEPADTLEHPNAPLLSAGTRRQNACTTLFEKAHKENYESGTAEIATVENLAALLALLQLSLFAEFRPIKSRPLLRSAVSHYRELQDEASTENERVDIRTKFGFALYTVDCLISAHARRECQISEEELRLYFSHDTRIIVPRLPQDELLPVVVKVVATLPTKEAALRTAKHLLACWVCACQRAFVRIVAPSMAPKAELDERISHLKQFWAAIDSTHAAAKYLLTLAPPKVGRVHSASPNSDQEHFALHEHDFGAQVIRLDRDLLDLLNLLHAHLSDPAMSDIPRTCRRESMARVRKALKRRAGYLKTYVMGVDAHMTFHELLQLELLPNWTELVLQRFGEPDGPESLDEEVTETELSWFIEGLQHACYYHPAAERRLTELAPQLTVPGDTRFDLSPFSQPTALPHPLARATGYPSTFVSTESSPSAWSTLTPGGLPVPVPAADPLRLPSSSPTTAPLGFSPSLGGVGRLYTADESLGPAALAVPPFLPDDAGQLASLGLGSGAINSYE